MTTRPTPIPLLADPSVMRCAVCGRALDPAGDMALMAFIVRRRGDGAPSEYRVYACGSSHAAEAMRRTAAAVDAHQFSLPRAGAAAWTGRHVALVGRDS